MISLNPQGVEFHALKVGKAPTRAAYRTDISGLRFFLEELNQSLSDKS